MVMICACFRQVITLTMFTYLFRTSDIVAVGTNFNGFNYDAGISRDSNLSPPRRRAYALRVKNQDH